MHANSHGILCLCVYCMIEEILNDPCMPLYKGAPLLLSFCCWLLSYKVASPAWPLPSLTRLFHPLLLPPTNLAAVMPCRLLRSGTA